MRSPSMPPLRRLRQLEVSAQGFGCLPTTVFYGSPTRTEATAVLRAALDAGVTLFDTADVQGLGAGEELLGEVLAGRRDEVLIATKFGMRRGGDGSFLGLCGRPEYVREACDASLRRLGTDRIDLYYQHWIDPEVPVEETAGAVAELVRAGKVRSFGLSEPSADSVRRADAVFPVTAVQSEWSLWSRDVEDEVVGVCRERGIGLVAYAPLGRGFLTGAIRHHSQLTADDFRQNLPRFQPANLERNLAIVRRLDTLARRLGVSAACLALAWLHHQGPDVIPIPGTTSPAHLADNLAATRLALGPSESAALREVAALRVHGERYRPEMLAMTGT
ncbi:aldo/keto reductase [Streptomyces aurantiacus]|uniref:Aldo/keto reductase n=2 Tax=Streptomyces aurantiacus TaxID=47760 RepID=A0A7G1NVS1_9ACTN|nr:aldo/keto reductase [Streptomyces aurantiacus]